VDQIRRYIAILQEYSIPLIIGVVAALVWANIHFDSYYKLVEFDFWNFGQGPFLDDGHGHDKNDFYIFGKHITVHFLINEVFMVFFFGIAAKEITESILPGGALNPIPKAINPLMGTLGGVFGPVGLFILLAVLFYGGSEDLGVMYPAEGVLGGWAIPTATDIALAWLVARVIFGNRHPAVNFLLLLAVADDAIDVIETSRRLLYVYDNEVNNAEEGRIEVTPAAIEQKLRQIETVRVVVDQVRREHDIPSYKTEQIDRELGNIIRRLEQLGESLASG